MSDIDYPGRDKHVQRREGLPGPDNPLEIRQEDLESVCQFLTQLPKGDEAPEEAGVRGVKDHPDSALLQLMAAGLEMDKGPFRCLPTWPGAPG